MAMKALGYVRISRVAGREGDSFLSPDLQRQSIARVCEREGLQLVEVLKELDRSGGDADRPLWNQAIERVEGNHHLTARLWPFDDTSSRDRRHTCSRVGCGGERRGCGSCRDRPGRFGRSPAHADAYRFSASVRILAAATTLPFSS